jgi:endonuclease YncB( thermonuclease family)
LVANRDAGLRATAPDGLAFRPHDAVHLRRAVRYARAERQARLQGIGLWRDPAPSRP